WSLTLIPLVKYSWLVIRASNDKGEGTCASCTLLIIGGTFILYMLLGQSFHFERFSQSDSAYSSLSETLESAAETDTELSDRLRIGEFKAFRIGLLIWTLL